MTALLLSVLISLGLSNQNTASLTLTFSGIKTGKGQLMVALNDVNGKMVEGYKVAVTKPGTLVYPIKNLKPGQYTMAVFHDINSDEELNTNMVGIPKEPYGFSNNARGTFGPPSFADQTFTISGETKMAITLK
jgi:uncharacterized protein (DUF2141 family)